jgi:phosphoglycerol transferase MdoB-like AlkP superfamily enzyme
MTIIWLILFLSILLFEVIFKWRLFIVELNDSFLTTIFFSLAYSLMLFFFLVFFQPKTMKRLMIVIMTILTILYLNQDIYHTIVENFYSVQIAGDFSLGLSFIGDAFLALRLHHVLYLFPIIIVLVTNHVLPTIYDGNHFILKMPLVILLLSVFIFNVATSRIDNTRDTTLTDYTYSDRDLYEYVYNAQLTIKNFGLLTYTQRDILNAFRTPPLFISEYEVLIQDYLNNQPDHIENDYSGIYEDKNLILIMAESFDYMAIHETLTPTLFMLKNDYGFFENYYSPLYYRSTADTEFMTQTGLFPNKNVTLSMDSYMDNTFPYTLPKMFGQEGYSSYSYHNYIDYFYPRRAFHTQTLGYDIYKNASDFGLLEEHTGNGIIFDHQWQKDTDLISMTTDDFIYNEPFFVNYITVSQHFQYNQSHEVASIHIDQVRSYIETTNEDIPEIMQYYLATAIELDLAVQNLMETLEDHDLLEDTVIMIYGDHYAYGIEENTIWDYDTHKEDQNSNDLHNVPMILYDYDQVMADTFTEYMSSIDILPTIANLFGLNMNYRYVFGRDVFSEQNHIVVFPDLSFVSKDFEYDALTESYRILNETYTSDELSALSSIFITKYRYNILILDNDYFKEDD